MRLEGDVALMIVLSGRYVWRDMIRDGVDLRLGELSIACLPSSSDYVQRIEATTIDDEWG